MLIAAVYLAGLSLFLYMKWEYRNIKVTNISLDSHDSLLGDIKIVYASDFQYDLYPGDAKHICAETFSKAIDMIMAEQADIILLGGDYLTYPSNHYGIIPYLERLEAPLGVYGVFGNHDHRVKDELKNGLQNIRFLENETVSVEINGRPLSITGVEDFWWGYPSLDISDIQTNHTSILLTHNPDFFETLDSAEKSSFNLVLAGHLHGGQITFFGFMGVPFVMNSASSYGEKYRYGEKEHDGGRIYVSSGLGGAVYHQPVRFGAQPEIVVIEEASRER